jgi:hypothetical protein
MTRTYAVASGFGPLIPNAGETGCHIPQHWGTAYASAMAGLFQPDQSNLLIVMPGESRWVRTGSQDRFGQEAPDTDARESRHCESPLATLQQS